MSKGSKPRPCKKKQYDDNFDKIKWPIKIYHDITCNCYDCRAGLSLRAKD